MSSDDWTKKDPVDVRTHYTEIGEQARLYDQLIWQIPSLAIAVVGGLVAVAYIYAANLILRTFILLLAVLWLTALTIATKKHQFFASIYKARLATIEKEVFKITSVQRTAIDTGNQYKVDTAKWVKGHGRNFFENMLLKQHSHDWLIGILCVTILALLVLIGQNIWLLLLGRTPVTPV